MPESDHPEILARGAAEWNRWRAKHAEIIPNLINAQLANADLQGANLGGAYLLEAQLQGADLRGANLRGTHLGRANFAQANLACADLIGANAIAAQFESANLERAHLIATQLSGIVLARANLTRADLREADLSYAYLTGANLQGANLAGANLTEADLIETRAIATNFSRATFTGACIQDWHTDCDTCLEDAICDYIYLQKFQQERCPQDPACRFPPGAFSEQFQKRRETIDLLFTDGIDWSALLASLHPLHMTGTDLVAIEQHADGTLALRLRSPSNADRCELETAFWERYNREWQRLETDHPELAAYRQQTANLAAIVQLQACHPRAMSAANFPEPNETIYRDAFLAIAAADAEPVVQFYRQLLDREPRPHVPNVYAEFQLLGGLRLGIFQPKSDRWPEFANSRHSGASLCLEVADLEAAIARLTSLGYPPPGEITVASHGREIYAYDPAGNRLILHQSPRSN